MKYKKSSFRFYFANFRHFCLLIVLCFCFGQSAFSQNLDRVQRGKAKDMLNAVKNAIKDDYYDTNYHGVDLDAKFKEAEEKLDKAATLGQAWGIIAQAVLELKDSHTIFYPPKTTAEVRYGWTMKMVGDKCFVTAVRPKDDAEKKGLKVGDEVLEIEGFKPNRKEFWKMNYYYRVLSPRTNLTLKVIGPNDKEPRTLTIASRVISQKPLIEFADIVREFEIGSGFEIEHRFVQVGQTMVWKMPSFSTDPTLMDSIMNGRIKQASNLILDLRGNGGGLVETLERLAGYFVEKDTVIAELKGRKKMKPQKAKSAGKDIFRGRLIVLIDSDSGSASEVFARFIQLEQRGIVMGDYSAGAVMQSIGYPMRMGSIEVSQTQYGISMTNADVIMSDGKSLEHVGVAPQLVLLPKASDLATERDPVLAAAFQLLEQTVTPEQAGKFFPVKWRNDF